MNSHHRYLLSIPLNVKDLNNIEECIPWEEIQFEDHPITKEDFNNLYKLFCEFDNPFGIFIDEYEEEIIPASGIQTAVQITQDFAVNASPKVKESADKFLVALNRAKELGKQLLLSF